MPSNKRKLDDVSDATTEDPAPKKSKKQAREEALRRAREAMATDAAKVKANRSKHQDDSSKPSAMTSPASAASSSSSPSKEDRDAAKRRAKTAMTDDAAKVKANKSKQQRTPVPSKAKAKAKTNPEFASNAARRPRTTTPKQTTITEKKKSFLEDQTAGETAKEEAPPAAVSKSPKVVQAAPAGYAPAGAAAGMNHPAQFAAAAQAQNMHPPQPQPMYGNPAMMALMNPYGHYSMASPSPAPTTSIYSGYNPYYNIQQQHQHHQPNVNANVNPYTTAQMPYAAYAQQNQGVGQNSQMMAPLAQEQQQKQPPSAPVQPSSSVEDSVKSNAQNQPPAFVQSTRKTKDDDEDDVMPPPPVDRLRTQISQQVLANASANLQNQPSPHTRPPPEAYSSTMTSPQDAEPEDEEELEQDDQPIVVDGIEEVLSSVGAKRSDAWCVKTLVIVLAIAFVLSMLVPAIFSETISLNNGKTFLAKNASRDGICFLDSEPRYETVQDGDETRQVPIQPCPDMDTALSCPPLGRCQDGHLIGCRHSSFVVNSDATECILTPATLQVVDLWRQVLTEKTVEQMCRGDGEQHGGFPVFDYRELRMAYPETLGLNPLDLQVLRREFQTQSEENGYFIGLKEDYAIQLPWSCRFTEILNDSLRAALSAAGTIVWMAFKYFSILAWDFASAYPLISVIGLITIVIVQKGRTYQAKRRRLICDVAAMRDAAFTKLMADSNQSHGVLHLRDAIVSDLVGNDDVLSGGRKQREYWNSQVWPRVKPQLVQDNRIRKFQKVVNGGKKSDYWQWVAATTTSSKKKTSFGFESSILSTGKEPKKTV